MSVFESPAFARIKEQGTQARMPIVEVLCSHRRSVLLSMGARFAENGVFYIFSVFVLTYGTQHRGLPRSLVLAAVLIAAGCNLFTLPLFGALSDRLGRRPVYLGGAVFTALVAVPYFWLVDQGTLTSVTLATVLSLSIGHAAMYGPQASFLSELFGTNVRYSGASLGYQLASVFAGGMAPLVATALLAAGGGQPWLVSTYVMGMAIVTTVSVALASETAHGYIASQR